MVKADWILLIEAWTGRRYTLDIRDTDAGEAFINHATTDRVHQISELDRTTDVYLDALTVLPHAPSSNTVLVLPGKFQLYEKILTIDTPMESPAVPMILPKDCDPSVVSPIRWSILCAREDLTTNKHKLIWSHGKPDGKYPEIPYNCVPLAIVKVGLGLVKIEHQDILTWRSVKPGYDPDAKYWLAPVQDVDALYEKYGAGVDVPEGAQALVLSESKNYYWEDGKWRAQTLMPFDNTIFIKDLLAPTVRIDLPWLVTNPVELAVFRDGQYVVQGQDYDFVTYSGPAAYLVFNRILMPGQRIVVVRNPFWGAAYSPGGGGSGGSLPVVVVDVWVDGEVGNDSWDGSSANPFRTLQRGFDACAAYSNNVYRIHARRLKLADVVTGPAGHTCFGWVRNMRAQGLLVEIENDCEWNTDIDYAYILYATSFAQYVSHPVYYRVMHVETVASFADLEFFDGMDIYGGYTAFNDCHSTAEQEKALTIFAAGAAEMHECDINHLEVATNAILRAYHSNFERLTGYASGVMDLQWSNVHYSATFENAALIMSNTSVAGTGLFDGGYVRATNVDQKSGTSAKPDTTFFVGDHGCNMDFDHVSIDEIAGHGVYLHHGCSLYIADSEIHNCGGNGILLTHGTQIEAYRTDVSSCDMSGVMLELGSYGEFKDCFGTGSSRFGIECTGFSRGMRDNTAIWGGLGDYYELIPGSDTVAADRADMMPGTLDEKIKPGIGIYVEVVPSTAPGKNDFEIGVDVESLTTPVPGSSGVPVLNLAPYAHVYKRPIAIVEPGTGATPDPNSYVDVALKWPGDGYLSSVLRRISNPTIQNKLVLTNLPNMDNFAQQDEWRGTEFLADGFTLKNYPILGYPDGYWYVLAKPYMYGSLPGLNLASINSFTLDADVPAGTTLQVGFSINGGASWLEWDSINFDWVQIPGESVLIALQKAPQHTDIPTWDPACWERLRQKNGIAITVGFLLHTDAKGLPSPGPGLTPKVKSYTWSYSEDGYWLDISEHFERTFYLGRAVFKYKGTLGAVIDPPLMFTIYPLRDRG